MTSLPLGMDLRNLPCCPGAGARPPPKISPGAWSPRTEPSALKVWGGKMERPEQCGQSRCMLSKHIQCWSRPKFKSSQLNNPLFIMIPAKSFS